MSDSPDKETKEFNIADLPAFPPTDETGDVDLSLLDYNLSLSIPERIRQHEAALELVLALESNQFACTEDCGDGK